MNSETTPCAEASKKNSQGNLAVCLRDGRHCTTMYDYLELIIMVLMISLWHCVSQWIFENSSAEGPHGCSRALYKSSKSPIIII